MMYRMTFSLLLFIASTAQYLAWPTGQPPTCC